MIKDLSVGDVAEALNLHVDTVRGLIQCGILIAYRVSYSPNSPWRIRERDLETYRRKRLSEEDHRRSERLDYDK